MTMNHKQECLFELQQALNERDWETATTRISQALDLGLTHDQNRVPLQFLQENVSYLWRISAVQNATYLMTEAKSLTESGQVTSAKGKLKQSIALPHLDPLLMEEIESELMKLKMLDDFDPETDRLLEQSLNPLLQRIEDEQPTLNKLLQACAIPLWWDERLLADIRNLHDGREQIIAEKLSQLSFITTWPDHYIYSQLARPLLLQALKNSDSDFTEINHRIVNHFQQRLKIDRTAQNFTQYERWEFSYIYHLLPDQPQQGVSRLITTLKQIEDSHQLPRMSEYVGVLQEVQARIAPEYRLYIDYAEGWMHTLYGRHKLAQKQFEEILASDYLLPDLKARVQRHIGNVLVKQRKWSQAIPYYHNALGYFEKCTQIDEIADTMEQLGFAYMDIASSAYGSEDRFESRDSWGASILQTIGLIGYLPLIVYMLCNFKLGWNVRAWWHRGRDMDWAVAKYFAYAIQWFQQAEQIYNQVDDKRGLNHVRTSLGKLYLGLHYTEKAEAFFTEVASEQAGNPYQLAYTHLSLAQTFFEQKKYEQAEELLHKALVVFRELEHDLRMAQTQTLLGKIAALKGDPHTAMQTYAESLNLWQSIGDDAAATSVIHRMEELDFTDHDKNEQSGLNTTIRHDQEPLKQYQQKISERVYQFRYMHPLMQRFQSIALLLFCFLVPFIMHASIGPSLDEYVYSVNIQMDQPKQTSDNPESEQQRTDPKSELGQELVFDTEISKSMKPQVGISFMGTRIGIALLAYLIIYAALGSYLLSQTKMEDIESQQERKIYIDGENVRERINGHFTRLLQWPQIQVYLSRNRRLLYWPIDFWSQTTLVGPDEQIKINGYAKGYRQLTRQIRRYLPQNIRYLDIGFSLLNGFWGNVVLLSIALFIAFVALDSIDTHLLTNSSLPTTNFFYNYHNVIFLGIYIPLFIWFVLNPLRGYLAYYIENLKQLWIMSWTTLGLTILGWLQFEFSLFSYKRPTFFLLVTVAILGCFILHQLYKSRKVQTNFGHIFQIATVAVLCIVVSLWITRREFVDSYSLLRAHDAFELADEQTDDNKLYEYALEHYMEVHERHVTPQRFSNVGEIYTRLSRYKDAVDTYEEATKYNFPYPEVYQLDLALAYQEWADNISLSEKRAEYYKEAISIYDSLIGTIEQKKQLEYNISLSEKLVEYYEKAISIYHSLIGTIDQKKLLEHSYHFRAATHFKLALLYNGPQTDLDSITGIKTNDAGNDKQIDMKFNGSLDRAAAIEYFEQAKDDYEWMIDNSNEPAASHIGRGWTLRYLQLSKPENTSEREQLLDEAIREFERAKESDDEYASAAYNGIGWVHYAISQDANIRGNCVNGNFANDQTKAEYIHQIESALDAFTQGISVIEHEQRNAYFFYTRAQFQYILGRCGEPYTKVEQDIKAIRDYHKALELDPARTEWRYRLGRLYYAVGLNLQKDNADDDKLYPYWEESAKTFLEIIATDPDYDSGAEAPPLEMLGILYNGMERSTDDLAEDFIMALEVEDTDEYLIRTAQVRLDNKNYELAYLLLKRVINRTPEHKAALLMLARTTYQLATQYDIYNQPRLYQEAIDIANRALDAGIENVELYTILARSHANQGDEQQVLAALQQAEPLLQAGNPLDNYLQGVIHISRDDVVEAKSAYEQGIQLMGQITDKSMAANIYAQAIGDVLLLPIAEDTDEMQLKFAGQMAVLVSEAALEAQGVNYTNRDEAWNAAESARESEEYEIAIPRYIKALTFAPDDYDIRLLLRNVLIYGYGMNGVTSGAAALTATLGVSEQSDVYDALLDIVKSELAEDTFGLAVVALERAQQLRPNETAAFLQHANIYLRWGEKWPGAPKAKERYTKAAESAQQALELDPTNLEALLILAHAYAGLEKIDDAIALVVEMLDKNPDDVQAILMQAHINFKQENYDEALVTIQEILGQNDEYIPAYLTQIGIYHANGEHQKAADAALQITESDPINKDAYLALGRLYRTYLKEYDKSFDAYREAIELDALNYRSFWTMIWDNRYRDASSSLYNTFMVNGRVLGHVGWDAYTNQKYELSIKASQEAINLMPNEPRHYSNQGLAYVAIGDIKPAQKSYSNWIKAANLPENSEIRLARLDEAIDDLRSINADPKDAAQQFINMLEKEKEVDDDL